MTTQHNPSTLDCFSVGEWTFTSAVEYENPFADLDLTMHLTTPSGETRTIPGFFDGDATWRVRFAPDTPGTWRWRTVTGPHDDDLTAEGTFEASASDARGKLRVTPLANNGFTFSNGEPGVVVGDTTYNLIAMAQSGHDVRGFMERRARQGLNVLRVRLQVSPFHPPAGHSEWQTVSSWPWGGSIQQPMFDRFNLEWFRWVDTVVSWAEELGIGLEMIMEAWGNEHPFNNRALFVPEWEELWMTYLIARYDASPAVWFWTPMNEYEFYPDGDWDWSPISDRWLIRIARWIRATAPHGTAIAAHNGPRVPPFVDRFRRDLTAIDCVMFQDWGSLDAENTWLTAGIEDVTVGALKDWPGAAILAEWGYEANMDLPRGIPGHDPCTREHTRRGAWRGLFMGLGIIHGFENTWGPWCVLDEDQPGVHDVEIAQRFATDAVPWTAMTPAQDLVPVNTVPWGHEPRVLATTDRSTVAIYLPAGGNVTIPEELATHTATWFDPRTGEQHDATQDGNTISAPPATGDIPGDWALILRQNGAPL